MSNYKLVKLKPTCELRKYFREVYSNEKDSEIPETVKIAAQNDFEKNVELEELLWLQSRLPREIHIYKLIETCDIVLPKPKVEPRNPILEARIQKLRKLEEEQNYRNMTKNVDSVRIRHPEDTIAYQVKEMNRQLIGVFQILISIGTGFVFGFVGVNWLIGPLDSGFRLLLGLMCAGIIGIAELYFFVKKLAEPIESVGSHSEFHKKKE